MSNKITVSGNENRFTAGAEITAGSPAVANLLAAEAKAAQAAAKHGYAEPYNKFTTDSFYAMGSKFNFSEAPDASNAQLTAPTIVAAKQTPTVGWNV